MERERPTRRVAMLAFKMLVLAAVVWGVWRTLARGWEGIAQYQWQVSWGWLALSGALYVVGLLPAAWYWRRAMIAMGGRPDWTDTLPAYFAGHLAKYVPGKVLVVLLRAGLLPRHAVPLRVAVVSVFLETFTNMAVGAVLVVALAPLVIALGQREVLGALTLAAVVGLPTLPPFARWLVGKVERFRGVTSVESEHSDVLVEGIDLRLTVAGWGAACLLWTMFGLSLGATLKAVDGGEITLLRDLPLLIATIALASVAGFASLMPGGLGVRDFLLVGLLAPRFGEATALVAGIGLRLVWIIAELVVYGILNVSCKLIARRGGARRR